MPTLRPSKPNVMVLLAPGAVAGEIRYAHVPPLPAGAPGEKGIMHNGVDSSRGSEAIAMSAPESLWMRRALELAERGRGHVEPNPLVGAVIVRDGQLVGEGWHQRYGEAHAEVHALAAAGELARDGTLYVT